EAYVALVDVTMSISTGRLQLDPPGMYMTDFNDSSITKFINDSSHAIYYLYRNRHHKYEWVDAQFGEIVPFGIDIGAQIHNTPCYFGRAKINGFYQFGPIVSLFGIMFYPGKETVQVTPVYQVLTCKKGHFPFYIGSTKINDEIFIGKVKPGEGLFFVDSNGKLSTTSSYEVLTCTQPDSSLGIYEEKKDEDWFGSFGCSKRKVWSFKKWKCICKEEFKNIFVGSGAKWIESSCSYEI
ncbi:hypothetical protein PVAND_017661, partial [Polypedilum vanderplanki]